MKTYTIVLVDPQPVARNGLKWVLASSCFSKANILEADSLGALTQTLLKSRADMILTDVLVPDRIGIDWIRELKSSGFARCIAVHTAVDHELLVRSIFRLGARGFVSKNLDSAHVVECLAAMAVGDHYVASNHRVSIERWLASGSAAKKRNALELTRREYSVVSLLAAGKNTVEIAAVLGLSARSVETYRSHILQKLGFRNTSELMAFAVGTGFVRPSF